MGHSDCCHPDPGLLYVYATLPEEKEIPPPATGEVRTVPPSWLDKVLSAYYEWKTDEPIVAIIRQERILLSKFKFLNNKKPREMRGFLLPGPFTVSPHRNVTLTPAHSPQERGRFRLQWLKYCMVSPRP